MTEVNEELIYSPRFYKELQSILRNGDTNVLTASVVRHNLEENLGLGEKALGKKPWKSMVNDLLDKALKEMADEQTENANQVEEDETTDDNKEREKDTAESLKDETLKDDEEKKLDTSEKYQESESDHDTYEDLVVAKKKEPASIKIKKRAQKNGNKTKTSSTKITSKAKSKKKSPERTDDEDLLDTSSSTNNKRKQKATESSKGSSPSDEKIKRLKSYVYKCGIRKKWNTELANLNKSEQIDKLQSILRDLGVEGRPTLEKCEKIKAERELKAEIDSLDTDNILDEEEGSRRSRNTPMKRKRRIIASDDDEDEEENNDKGALSKVAKTSSSSGLDLSFLGDQGSDSD